MRILGCVLIVLSLTGCIRRDNHDGMDGLGTALFLREMLKEQR